VNLDSSLVRIERQRRGWTQQQLADIAALSLRTVQRVENQGQGSNETVSALCSVMALEREALLVPSRVLERRQGKQWSILLSLILSGVLGVILGVTVTLLIVTP
jgi:transcriptional regulator with XRE-family HTH domain